MGNKERRGGVKGGDTTTLKGDPSRLGSHTAIIEQLILHADQVSQKKSRVSVQCCGSGMFIPDPNCSIPGPGSKDSASRILIRIRVF